MNTTFVTIWNATLGAWVAVSELARARSKSSGSGAVLVASVLLGTSPAYAVGPTVLPTGGQVSAGQAQITTGAGNAMTVTQASARAAINWNTFSIGKDSTVNFVQPNASAIALNRVTGREGSVIDGALTANGQVFILNPNGVLFGQGARVDTAGLVATTLGLSDTDFMAGKTRFSSLGGATGAVINRGTLNAKDGGYIALLGTQVKNDGVIKARLGTVALAAGNKVSLNFNGDSLVGVVVDEGALDALVANGGAVRADGGLVVLTAKGAEGLVNTLVNNTGEVRAQTVENRAGRIYLLGENGAVEVAGSLDASAPGSSNGGFIKTSAPVLKVHDGARVTTAAAAGNSGTWLIDPTDFTIGAGNGAQTSSGMGATTLQTALGAGNVTIQTAATGTENGDIFVNDAVTWVAPNTLTLHADRNIYVNADMTGQSSMSRLALEYGQGAVASGNLATYKIAAGKTVNLLAGNNFDTKLGSDGVTVNWTVLNGLGGPSDNSSPSGPYSTLQGIAFGPNLGGNFVLGSNIDAASTVNWNSGAGFTPIGNNSGAFTGRFDGLGHVIDNLNINRPGSQLVGLFGKTSSATLRNVGVTNAVVHGIQDVAPLVGHMIAGSVDNVYTSGTVVGTTAVGGLIGYASQTAMTNSYASSAVSGAEQVGGLVGASESSGTLSGLYATGNVTATGNSVGGLFGDLNDITAGSHSTLDNSYATGNVKTTGTTSDGRYVGGLIGAATDVRITNSYATGKVSGAGSQAVGGLIGRFYDIYITGHTSLDGAYASGAVTGGSTTSSVGGLIGLLDDGATVSRSYATGSVTTGGRYAGGLVGSMDADASITDSYARGAVSGADYVGALMGGPLLNASGYQSVTRVYGTGLVTSGGSYHGGLLGDATYMIISNSFWDMGTTGQLTSAPDANGTRGTGKSTLDMITTGTFTSAGWDFTFQTGVWGRKDSVNDKYPVLRTFGYTDPLTLTFTDASKVYGDVNPASPFVSVSGCPTINCVAAGWGSAISPTTGRGYYSYHDLNVIGLVFASGYSANQFDILFGDNSLVVSARPITLNPGATRSYNGLATIAGSLLTAGNLVNGDVVSLGGSAALASKNVGAQSLLSAAGLTTGNANYTVVGASGSVQITPLAVSVSALNGATQVYDSTTNAASGLLQITGVLSGDTANLGGSATLASKNVGAQALTLGGLTLDNGNYTLAGVTPTGTVAILPRTLNLSFAVADKTFDGNTAASATASDNRISGDQFTANFIAAFGDTNAGLVKAVTISGLALQGADAGNYQLASGSTTGVTGNMLARNLTYSLVAQDPTRTYTATGQVLVSAAALDQLVVASLANTIAGTSPGALSYTLWRNGQQVTDITQAGTYEIRANFATPDAHYALATTGNSTLTLTVSAATPGTPGTPGTAPTPPTTLPAATLASALTNTIAQAVRTDVPSTAAMLASAGVSAARPLAEFAPMAANVASPIPGLNATFGEGAPLSLISSPDARETSTSVTLEQARRMLKVASTGNGGSADAGSREVRVPVSRNSLAEIVNGGVKLPSGVDQLLFVVKAGQ